MHLFCILSLVRSRGGPKGGTQGGDVFACFFFLIFFHRMACVSLQTQPAVCKIEPGFHLEVTHEDHPVSQSVVVLYQGAVRYHWESALFMTERTSMQNLLQM